MGTESLQDIVARETEPDDDENGDDEQDGQGEGEPEAAADPEAPDASYVPPELDFEAQRKKLDKETDRHEKRVREIMADDAELLEACPLCQVPGFVFPFTEADPSAEPRRNAVMEYFGGAEPPFVSAPDKALCGRCDGWGQVLTGAKNPTHRVGLCSTCNGNGWTAVVEPMPQSGYQPVPGEVSPPPLGNGLAGHAPDVWERPYGHPHYGVPPALVNG